MDPQVKARLAILKEYEIMDTPAEAQFDDLTQLASEICGAPVGLISLLNDEKQWFKSKIGTDASESPLEHAFCRYAIRSSDVFQIPDTTADANFRDNPLVVGAPYIRFYAGAPLVAPDGTVFGTLCVVDTKPRELNGFQKNALTILAKQVVIALEQRKQALRAAREREREFEIATNAASVGIWEWIIATGEFRLSAMERQILGLTHVGPKFGLKDFEAIVFRDDFKALQETLQRCLRGEAEYNTEFRIIRNGEIRWITGRGTVIRDSEGQPVRMVGANMDITAIRKSAFEREEMRMRESAAISASRLKTEFLANMSHEIRTPLNGIVGLANLLLDENLSHGQLHFAESIKKLSNALLLLINDILDVTKIEAGKLELENGPFSLSEMIVDIEQCYAPLAREKNIEFQVRAQIPSAPYYLGDMGRIRQIFNNLIGNALKFTSHGRVSIDIIESYVGPESSMFEVRVSDTGIGIKPAAIKNLFQNFTQADASTARKFGGTGLGLAICKRLVKMMGGNITVESHEGRGSAFTFKIPLVHAQAQHMETLRKRETPAVHPLTPDQRRDFRILIAEDNPVNQEVALRMLEKAGYKGDVVANGYEVMTALRAFNYDLVLMDCQMPEMDGYEASFAIRQWGYQIPIVALTANAFKEDRDKCLKAGMSDYLSKPIHFDDLISTIDRWLSPTDTQAPAPTAETKAAPRSDKLYVDVEILERLKFLDKEGTEKIIPKLIRMYFDQAPQKISELRGAVSLEPQKVKKMAHAFKSSSANLGAREIVSLLQRIEDSEFNTDEFLLTLNSLDEAYAKTREQLAKFM